MKKDRNAFFQNNSSSSYFYPTNPMIPYPMATESNSNFYSGPAMMPNMPVQNNGMSNDYNSELESRLAKIERQINRLDSRVSKLESESVNISNQDYTNNNMYMV